jgi:hypothetical protein
MTNQLTLNEVLESKIFVNSSAGTIFKSPKDYIEPFIDSISGITSDFTVQAVDGSINANDELDFNKAFSRVLIEANLPKDKYSYLGNNDRDTLDSKIGFIYALDLGKPIMKVFAGKDVRACTNLTIFDAEHLYSQEMTGNINSIYKKATEYANNIEKDLEEFLKKMNILINSRYEGSKLDELNGRMIKAALKKPKLGTTPILSAIKDIYDPKSVYSIDKVDKSISGWTYYNAVTENLKKADIVDRSLKTVLLSEIILSQN